MENIYAQRIDAIRSIMKSKGIDAMVITGSDPHNSEYPAPRWKQVEWVSGFTGEAGDLVITADHAGLDRHPLFHPGSTAAGRYRS